MLVYGDGGALTGAREGGGHGLGVAAYLLCYLAFQLGHHALAATALGARLRHQLTQEEHVPSPFGRGLG